MSPLDEPFGNGLQQPLCPADEWSVRGGYVNDAKRAR